MRLTGLTPTEFTLLFATAAMLAVFFYLLSFRRRTAILAADPIWRRVIGRRRTPFRKLLALLGQLLVLFLLSLALGDPRTRPEGVGTPVAVAVVVDASASMAATESGGTRIQRAARLVESVADRMGPRDRMALMIMDDSCRPLTTFGSDPEAIRKALATLTASLLPEDTKSAIRFANAAFHGADLPDDSEQRIILVSDRFHDLPAPKGDTALIQVAVGDTTNNLAVTAFDVRMRGGAARGSEVFVEVTNYGDRARKVRLSIHTPAALLGEEVIEVKASGTLSRTYFMKTVEDDRVMATLTAPRGSGQADAFGPDDRAYALVPREEGRQVLLVTEGNLYLEKVLGLNPSVNLKVIKPRQFRSGALEKVQAVVFDGVCPDSPVSAIYFNPPADPGCPFGLSGRVEFPALLPLRGDHPVTDGVSLVDMQIREANRLVPQGGDVELLRDPQGPLIIARESNGSKKLGLGFDLNQSDLPLRIAFPLLLHNCLDWFLGEVADDDTIYHHVGGILFLPDWVEANTPIFDPASRRLRPRRFGETWQLRPIKTGYFTIGEGKNKMVVPVNFHLREESILAGDRKGGPDRIRWREGKPPPALVAGFDMTETPEMPIQWPLLLLAAAWVLLFDWVFFCFRILF